MTADPALRIYERSLACQWNADRDLDWTTPTAIANSTIEAARRRLINELYWSEHQSLWTVQRMAEPIRRYFGDDHLALCAAAHAFEEARHVYVLERYCRQIGALEECPLLWRVITRIADMMGSSVESFFFSVMMSETLGEVLFAMLRRSHADDLLKQICEHALRDEARHISYVVEALRRIHPRLSSMARRTLGIKLQAMLHFGLRSLRRTERDAATLGVDRDVYLDIFERKLGATIRRAGVEDVLSPDRVHAIVRRFRDMQGELAGPESISEIIELEHPNAAGASGFS